MAGRYYNVYDAKGRFWKRLKLTPQELRAFKRAYKKLSFLKAGR